MTRDEFSKYHWEYYLVLEKDFLQTERFISFDLGKNYLYDKKGCTNYGNSMCFSNEFIKQYQSICSEIDVILKTICKEINNKSKAKEIKGYTNEVLKKWPGITNQKVAMKDIELIPFMNWSLQPYNSPDWWPPYNNVKHKRVKNYKEANLKNVLNSLAALYILEHYLVKYIGDRDSTYDVPNDISQLFEMVNYKTRKTVVGRNSYLTSDEELYEIFND